MDEIEQIKNAISIYDLASRYGAEPKVADSSGAVACKKNPLRSEKTSSLFIYPSTNSWFDQGSQVGGSIIDWIMVADGVGPGDAIGMIKSMAGMDMASYSPSVEMAKPVPKTYLHNHESISKIFAKCVKLTMKDHRDEMLSIAPEYVYQQTTKENAADFHARIKYDANYKTSAILVKDGDNNSSIRHRRISEGGEVKKWKALKDAKASVPYIRDNRDDLLLIVEGSHDFLTAILSGYSVIALPQTGFKLEPSLVTGRKCLFVADDDAAGRDGMAKTIAHCAGEGVMFDHEKFRKDNGITTAPKDFSEYMESFSSIRDFQVAIALHVETLHQVAIDIDAILDSENDYVTLEYLDNLANTAMLIPEVLQQSAITILVGKPGVGKSAITLSFLNLLFRTEAVDRMLYFDADNGPQYTKERLENLIRKHGQSKIRYYHQGVTTKTKMLEKLKLLSTMKNGERTVIVIDSLKNFIKGSNTDDKMANELFDDLQMIRDRFGATIIILHHTKKGKNEDGSFEYVGSQVIEASADNLTYIDRKENLIRVTPSSKTRAILEKKAYEIDIPNMEIIGAEYPEEDEDEEKPKRGAPKMDDDEAAEIILSYLQENGPTAQTVIVRSLMGNVSKATTERVLWSDAYKNELWTYEKMKPKGWQFTAIKKRSGPEVIEYKAEMPILF